MERGGITIGRQPRVVKMTWDVDTDAALMLNSVSMREAMEEEEEPDEEEEDQDMIAELVTPHLPTTAENLPPGVSILIRLA